MEEYARRRHYEEFKRNFMYNQTFLADYYKDYNSLVQRRGLVIGLLTLLSIYLVIGPIGNIAIIGAIFTNKLLFKPLNVFIINLSIADLIEVTIITSTSITGLTIGHQVFLQNPVLCSVVANICVTSCVASILTHMTIAITRYLSIRYPTSFVNSMKWTNVICWCIFIWIAAFLLQMPPDVGWGRNVYDLKQMICIWDRTYSIGYTLYFAIVFVFTPVTIIFFCYIRLFLHIRRIHMEVEANENGYAQAGPNTKDIIKNRTNLSKRRWKQEYRLAKTLFAHFAMVFLLWGQYAFIVIFDFHNRLPMAVHASSIQIAHSIAVLNVFIYLSNPSFRAGMIAFITRKPIKMVLMGMGTTMGQDDYSQTKHSKHSGFDNSRRASSKTRQSDLFRKMSTPPKLSIVHEKLDGVQGKRISLKEPKEIIEPYVPGVPFDDDVYIGPDPS